MSAIIFDSKPLVARMTAELQSEAAQFRKQRHRPARLAQIVAGHDGAAEVYSRQQVVTEVLRPEKDVDGLGPYNAGNLLLGFPSFIPSTADVILTVLQEAGIPIAGRNAVVVGRSNIGGKPVALVLMRQDATVTICHSYTRDLASITRSADILVVSIGQPASITADMVMPGAVVLDAGINPIDGKVVGDVEFDSVKEVASFLTPVPGGLGPLTHLMLIRHTLIGPQ